MSSLSRSDLEKAARQFFEQLVRELDRPRDFPEDDWDNQIAHQIELSRERIGALNRQLVTKIFDQQIECRAASVVEETGSVLEALDEADQTYAMQLAARAERCSTAKNGLCNIKYFARNSCTTSHPVRRDSAEFLIIKSDSYGTSRIHNRASLLHIAL